MPNKMLIDATHPEETRVVVVRGNRVEEFDFETAQRKQLRGNIYLAKVTRVEPSLQAAFVEYGGNRLGFLAFSEIHPDYYQIPVADREALMRAEEEEDDEHEDDESSSAAADAPAAPSVSEGAADDPSEQTERAPTEAAAEADPQSPATTDEEEAADASHIEEAPANNEPVESLGGSADV